MEKTPEEIAQEDKEIREFIFKINMMGTTEFCNFVSMAVPYYKSGKTHSELAQEFITVEAIKCKTIIEFAKEVKRRKQNEKIINNASNSTSNDSNKL